MAVLEAPNAAVKWKENKRSVTKYNGENIASPAAVLVHVFLCFISCCSLYDGTSGRRQHRHSFASTPVFQSRSSCTSRCFLEPHEPGVAKIQLETCCNCVRQLKKAARCSLQCGVLRRRPSFSHDYRKACPSVASGRHRARRADPLTRELIRSNRLC